MHKVVVIDDEPHILQGWKTMVDWKNCGFELIAAMDDSEEALVLIEDQKPDLIITDIRMPDIDGLELIQEIRERIKISSRIVIMTGYSEFCYVQQAMPYKVDRYLLKPIISEEIHAMLKELACSMKDLLVKQGSLSKDEHSIGKVIQYLKQYYYEPITVLQLADKYGYHPGYLGQLFKEKTGASIHDYVHQLRIQEGQKLLLQTEMKVSAIANLLGYRDPDHFVAKFKKHTKMTPSSFKNLKSR